MASEGTLKRNKPGAAIWVTENETWVVSKASMEAVQQQLLAEGHKSIPKNPVRLFDILREHNLIKENPHGDSVWYGLVNYHPTNWRQKLTFLRFENNVLWPTSNPDRVRGEIIPVTKEGEPINETHEITSQNNEQNAEQVTEDNERGVQSGQESGQQPNAENNTAQTSNINKGKLPEIKQPDQSRPVEKSTEAQKPVIQKYVPAETKNKMRKEETKGQGSTSKKQEKAKIKAVQTKQEAVDENGFFQWLVADIKSRCIFR